MLAGFAKNGWFTYAGRRNEAEAKFFSGECAMLTSSSSALDKINAKDLGVLPAMEDTVEGSAHRLAAAAEKGDMGTAAQQFGAMSTGCVACHAHFRGQPGTSPRLK